MVGSPFRFSAPPVQLKAPPQFGADTDNVLQQELKLSDARIAELRAERVL